MEADFPRGGGAPKTKSSVPKSKRVGGHAGRIGSKKVTNKIQLAAPTSNTKFNFTPETIHVDVLLLGCVNALRRNEVIIELPHNIKGVLTGHESTQFHLGQCLAVGVTGPPVSHLGTAMVPLTVLPSIVNRSLKIGNLKAGMYISGIVSSVEDRGYSVDTAISDTSSFIAKTQTNLILGQPVFSVITDISVESKRIFLTPQEDAESTFKNIQDWKSVSLENIRPGNATKAEVTHKYLNGLGVKIYNQPATSPLSAFVPAQHLPQPVDNYAKGFRMSGKILSVDYRSQSVMITALPHLVNHQPILSLFGDYMGVRGLTFSVPTPPVERPVCLIPTKPPIQALLSGLDTNGTEDNSSKKEREVEVKVIGVSFLLNMVVASADPFILDDEHAALNPEDFHPGMAVTGTVTAVSKAAIEVQISPSIHNAQCQANHLTDASSLQNIQAIFHQNEQVQCRVLHIDDDDTVYLTNKPTLVNSTLPIIASYQHTIPGCVAHGWISKVTRSEVFVSFYNNVTGVVPSSDIKEGKPDAIYQAGEVVVCQVVECGKPKTSKSEKHTLILTFDIQLMNKVPTPLGISALRKAFTSVNVGEIVSGIVSHTDLSGLTLVLDSGITGFLPAQHLSDSHAACPSMLSQYYVGTKLTDILVLNKDSSNMRLVLSKKVSLQLLVSEYQHMKVSQVLPAHVKQISDLSITVGFLGTNKATISIARVHDSQFVLGQSVRVVVKNIGGPENGLPTVDIFDPATRTNGLVLLREYFAGIDSVWSHMEMAKTKIGEVVSGEVLEHRGSQIFIHLDNQLTAFVDTYSLNDNRHYAKGNKVKGVVLDLDYANALVQLSLDQKLVKDISHTSPIPVDKDLFGTVLLANAIYLVVCVTYAKNKQTIVYVPGCDYNTQGQNTPLLGGLKVGSEVLVVRNSSEPNEKRPLFSLKEFSGPSPITNRSQTLAKSKAKTKGGKSADSPFVFSDGEEEEEEEEKELKEEEGDDTDGAFAFRYMDESSDDEVPPELDDLQTYLARVSHIKGKMLAKQHGVANSQAQGGAKKQVQGDSKNEDTKKKEKKDLKKNDTKNGETRDGVIVEETKKNTEKVFPEGAKRKSHTTNFNNKRLKRK
eukprot:Phypoly_transcript_01449.p1 GENE.Phypoly_transcript_01449~~Phypoly_transcript_01449.p1  ORF type:complete len:1104 (+),score=169.15 Phypoly_transcript_01449:74-3385(+)